MKSFDEIARETRARADERERGYRARALKMYPWVCGRCARAFTHANLQQLEVHHRNGNHDDTPSDGSNWELLCTYCHEHEHSKVRDSAGRSDGQAAKPGATFSPFADLKERLQSGKRR